MDKLALLKAVYQSIQWDRLYEIGPQATRQEVDDLFRDLRERLGPPVEEEAAADVAGGEAVVRTDGASKGNPGPSGIGIVIETPDGREVAAWGESIGRTTNNAAEYRAAIAGLEKARELGARRVRLLADSQLLVRQLAGRYRVKSAKLKPLHQLTMNLLGQFEDWKACHVPREENARADSLASRAARQNAGG